MTLKGNLEVLNLSDIFQSLSLNQHTGTLRVTDGKREKLVHFAQGEITLLASEKKVKIGEMLVASGKISSEDLDYALQQQKKSKKRLGEILIEEGFVSEDDIAEIVKQQIEAEIYDLFLWKKADFEFLIDYIPEKLKNPSHGITRLQFNTSSLIMEALRRLDEWGLISKEISTLKEVYKLVNASPTALEEIELPERVKAEVRLVDGEKTLEQIVEETSLSEFELCKLIFECKQRGIVAPLTPQELSDKAEECFQKGKFRQAAALYERLVEVLPKNLSIRWHLADSQKAFGDEARALEQYQAISVALEGTRDRIELAKAYRAILDLAPDRKDILEKLRELDKAKWQRTALKSGMMIAVVATIAVGGLMAAGGKDKAQEWFKAAESWIGDKIGGPSKTGLEEREKESTALLKEMEDAYSGTDYKKGRERARKILKEFPDTEARRKVRFPLIIRSDPDKKAVFIDGQPQTRPTDCVAYLSAKMNESRTVTVELREGERLLAKMEVDPTTRDEDVEFDLWRKPAWSAASGGAVRGAPVFRGQNVYFTSLDGYLYGKDYTAPAGTNPNLRQPLTGQGAPFGFFVSPMVFFDDMLVMGTLDGEVKAFNTATRSWAFTVRIAPPGQLAAPLLAGPVVTQGGIAVFGGWDGIVGFVDVRRAALAASSVYTGNQVVADLAESGGTAIVAGRDNNIWGLNAAGGTRSWSHQGRGDFVAQPRVIPAAAPADGGAAASVVVGDLTGYMNCLDAATGVPKWGPDGKGIDIQQPIVGIDASSDTVFVTTRSNQLYALQLGTGATITTAQTPTSPTRPIVAPSTVDPGQLVVMVGGANLFRAFDAGPAAPTASAQITLGEVWTAKSTHTFRGRPVLWNGRLYIGSDDGTLYAFDP